MVNASGRSFFQVIQNITWSNILGNTTICCGDHQHLASQHPASANKNSLICFKTNQLQTNPWEKPVSRVFSIENPWQHPSLQRKPKAFALTTSSICKVTNSLTCSQRTNCSQVIRKTISFHGFRNITWSNILGSTPICLEISPHNNNIQRLWVANAVNYQLYSSPQVKISFQGSQNITWSNILGSTPMCCANSRHLPAQHPASASNKTASCSELANCGQCLKEKISFHGVQNITWSHILGNIPVCWVICPHNIQHI